MEKTHPKVSVVIPARNESQFIEKCILSLVEGDFPHGEMEILVIDGQSDDGTRDQLDSLIQQYPGLIHVYSNEKQTTPHGLNIGIENARGEYIARADSHSVYPKEYISTLLNYLERHPDVENVGIAFNTRSAGSTDKSKAIAEAMIHPLGVGQAQFRLGVEKPTEVETVPYGFFRKSLFKSIGTFDENLVRNQDDEFNHRILATGKKIVLLPDLRIDYFVRQHLNQLFKMYYQYGLYKPLVLKKLKKAFTLRQFLPAMFLISLFIPASIFLASGSPLALDFFLFLLGTYAITLFLITLGHAKKKKKSAKFSALMGFAIATMHFSYGIGYLHGFFQFFVLRKKTLQSSISR